MRFALSTNWNNGRLNDGAAIADEALALGFDSLELGFRTMPEQLPGFRSRLDRIPVTSVHAYTPVPPGAPSGHPELHQLLVRDPDERAWARFLLKKTFACAAEFGAKTVVFHAGYVDLVTFFSSYGAHALSARLHDAGNNPKDPKYVKRVAKARALRTQRGRTLVERFKREFELLLPDLKATGVTLALENLPRIEGFPYADEAEELMKTFAGGPLGLWFDTGHARVRACHGWSDEERALAERVAPHVRGLHLNDVKDLNDDHRQPGWGNVDFAALGFLAKKDGVLSVFEPHQPVTFDELKASLARMRALWA